MANKIGWCDTTWSPVSGCTPVSEGCKNCYAKRMATRLRGRFGYPADEPFRVTLHPERLDEPLRWKKSRRVFVVSMGDLFHPDVPDTFLAAVAKVIRHRPRHTFMVLTKRPKRMSEWAAHLSNLTLLNLWPGVTVENDRHYDRIGHLLNTPAAVRFVSVEPMLGPVDLKFGPLKRCRWCGGRGEWKESPGASEWHTCECMTRNKFLNWVICGGETGPGARPMDPDWPRDLLRQCRAAGVPFFFKKMGRGIETPDDLNVREWPAERTA